MKKKKGFKTHFVQDWGTYPNQTMVFIGYTKEEIDKVNKKLGVKKDILKEIEEAELSEVLHSSDGMVLDFTNGSSMLWLKTFDPKDWKCYETLIHEITHLIQLCMTKFRGMENEYEAQAYQTEYLFKNIRQNIFKAYDKRK